jgi:hypothetical protein
LSLSLIATLLRYWGEPSATLARVPWQLFGFMNLAVASAWLYIAWRSIPERYRGTISPGRAAFSFFIPIYGIYWVLAVTRALCDALDRIFVEAGSDRRAPRQLGIFATVTFYANVALGWANSIAMSHPSGAARLLQWASYGSSHLDHALWLVYAFASDEALGAAVQIAKTGDAAAAPDLSHVQTPRRLRLLPLVAFWVVAAVGFLACWQILQPGERQHGSSVIQQR